MAKAAKRYPKTRPRGSTRSGKIRHVGLPFEGIASGPTIRYVIVPASVPFRNPGLLWVRNRLAKRAPRLAICHDLLQNTFSLLFCDGRWRIGAVVGGNSVEEVQRLAEKYYPGLSRHWVDLGVTEASAKDYMERLRKRWGCSFCGRTPAEHGGAQFQKGLTRICVGCVKEFYQELSKDDPPNPG